MCRIAFFLLLLAEGHNRRRGCGVLPVDAEVLPQIPQQVLTERVMLRGLQELSPQIAHLVVRDLRE